MSNKEEFIQEACNYLRKWKKIPAYNDEDSIKILMEIVNKSQKLKENIALEDIKFKLHHVCTFMHKALKDITEKDFIEYLKSDILSEKEYTFCFPIYKGFRFPSKLKLGFTTTFVFEDINPLFREAFIDQWKNQYSINSEYFNSEQKFLEEKKRCLFLVLTVKAYGHEKASEKALIVINESLNILRILYNENFPIEDFRYIHKRSKLAGGAFDFNRPLKSWKYYTYAIGFSIKQITEIITKENPTKIESRIRNAISLFGIYTSINNISTSFLMLMTCLESLLLSGSDKDYIGWKLAEKSAFLIGEDGKDRKKINEYIIQAYKKRSKFIHGESKKIDAIKKADVDKMQILVNHVLNKLIDLRLKGFTQMKKNKNNKSIKSINEYLEDIIFGLKQENE